MVHVYTNLENTCNIIEWGLYGLLFEVLTSYTHVYKYTYQTENPITNCSLYYEHVCQLHDLCASINIFVGGRGKG